MITNGDLWAEAVPLFDLHNALKYVFLMICQFFINQAISYKTLTFLFLLKNLKIYQERAHVNTEQKGAKHRMPGPQGPICNPCSRLRGLDLCSHVVQAHNYLSTNTKEAWSLLLDDLWTSTKWLENKTLEWLLWGWPLRLCSDTCEEQMSYVPGLPAQGFLNTVGLDFLKQVCFPDLFP